MAHEKKGILVVSFGTSYAQVRTDTIEACEKRIAEAFPEYQIRRAFTSGIIRKILRERDGFITEDTAEALVRMREEGFLEVIIQPLHIIPGEEYHEKVLQVADRFRDSFRRLAIGRPILMTIEDYYRAAEALEWQLPPMRPQQGVVLMGHGSTHPANASYACLQLVLRETRPDVLVATVEGYPTLAHIIPQLKERGISEVILMPYMLVAGDHALNDMAGAEEDSWRSVLTREGFNVQTFLHGLGENPRYQDLYLQHIRDCLQEA